MNQVTFLSKIFIRNRKTNLRVHYKRICTAHAQIFQRAFQCQYLREKSLVITMISAPSFSDCEQFYPGLKTYITHPLSLAHTQTVSAWEINAMQTHDDHENTTCVCACVLRHFYFSGNSF
jgi:hypothetical protein